MLATLAALALVPTAPAAAEPTTRGGPPTGNLVPNETARTIIPTPTVSASRADSTTSAFTVGGVRVILRRTEGNNVVAANLYLLGGTRDRTPDDAGIEPLLLHVSERGTRRYPGAAARTALARLGSEIVVAPSADWTVFGLRATVGGLDSTWTIWADRLLHPTLDSGETELVRAQFASAVRQRREDPDALVTYLADSAAFAGHPYGLSPVGTERSIDAITVADLRRFQTTQLSTSRLLLVVVGDVTRARVERLAQSSLATLPRGTYRWTPPPAAPTRLPGATPFVTVARSLPTNYIQGYFAGPPASSPDYQALRIATAALSGRLFTEVRSRRNLTYAVNAPFVERAQAEGGLYVTTVAPDQVLGIMRTEIGNLQRGTVDPVGLEQLVQQFITQYFLDNETNADQANFLARADLYRGDYRLAGRFVDELRAVTPEDVRRVARQYMTGTVFAYVGDPTKLAAASFGGF
jgi:zinc protease